MSFSTGAAPWRDVALCPNARTAEPAQRDTGAFAHAVGHIAPATTCPRRAPHDARDVGTCTHDPAGGGDTAGGGVALWP